MKKIFLLLTLFVFSSVNFFGQSVPKQVPKGEEDWRTLLNSQTLFEEGDYSNALIEAEKAKSLRKQKTEWDYYVLENLLRKSKIRKLGDKLDQIVEELQKDENQTPLNVINFYLEKKGIKYFDSSFKKLLAYVSDFKNYPEADYLIGKIYKLEGETTTALSYFNKAYKYNRNLDIESEKYVILNDLADLYKELNDFDNYEKTLLLIVKDNSFYSNNNFMSSIIRLINDKDDALENFFKLYRCSDSTGLKTLIMLSDFYLNNGKSEKALKCSALASVIAVTKLDSVIAERENDYSYVSLSDLLTRVSKYEDIVQWGNDNYIWKLFYNLADISGINGKLIFAKNLFKLLSLYEPEEYWKTRASLRLK